MSQILVINNPAAGSTIAPTRPRPAEILSNRNKLTPLLDLLDDIGVTLPTDTRELLDVSVDLKQRTQPGRPSFNAVKQTLTDQLIAGAITDTDATDTLLRARDEATVDVDDQRLTIELYDDASFKAFKLATQAFTADADRVWTDLTTLLDAALTEQAAFHAAVARPDLQDRYDKIHAASKLMAWVDGDLGEVATHTLWWEFARPDMAFADHYATPALAAFDRGRNQTLPDGRIIAQATNIKIRPAAPVRGTGDTAIVPAFISGIDKPTIADAATHRDRWEPAPMRPTTIVAAANTVATLHNTMANGNQLDAYDTPAV